MSRIEAKVEETETFHMESLKPYLKGSIALQ